MNERRKDHLARSRRLPLACEFLRFSYLRSGHALSGYVLIFYRNLIALRCRLSVVRDFETGGGLNQERVWRIMVDVTRLVCGEATDGFGWSCV